MRMPSDTTTSDPAWVDFHFDPMCPWAYQGSRWIREVRNRTGLEIRWRFFSLEEINRETGKKHPWEREWSYGWSQMRVGALLRRDGHDVVDRWYEAVGQAFFVDGRRTFEPDTQRDLLAEIGLDPAAVDQAIADPTTTDEVRADHDVATREHGAFGVPTLVFPDGNSVYGPVILPAPTGDDAVALWDLIVSSNRFPTLYELRHPKRQHDLETIAAAFSTYIETRAWRTIENPAP
jgi:predicted DsbA family dithiol-disulfide isomerase